MVKYNQGTEQRVNNKMRFCKFFKFILDGSCIMIIFKLLPFFKLGFIVLYVIYE